MGSIIAGPQMWDEPHPLLSNRPELRRWLCPVALDDDVINAITRHFMSLSAYNCNAIARVIIIHVYTTFRLVLLLLIMLRYPIAFTAV